MDFKKLNNLGGLVALIISLVSYLLTLEPTVSLWDCGEFIAASNLLMVVHPPGAPLFLMLGRFFSLFAGGDLTQVASMVNSLSALASALTVMFTFWIITYYAKRIIVKNNKENEPDTIQKFLIIIAGLVGSLALTYTDTFWFSAVEAEVYALSSFFTAITFWAILKWERVADEPGADRWIVLIGYLIGLAVGVHLLNLLVIPAILYVYFFKKFNYSLANLIKATVLGFIILGFIQVGVIPGLPALAASLDRLFVNSFGLGFGSGVIFLAAIVIAGLIYGLYYSHKKVKPLLNTILLAFTFILIGYSSYTMVIIRSLANPPIDMNNPDDPYSLVYYLNREQYGSRPLLRGSNYMAQVIKTEKGSAKWVKGENKYENVGNEIIPIYDAKHTIWFPRIYDPHDNSHIVGYREWTNVKEGADPTMADNLEFLFKYQLGHMYFRYFFWNFVGRQNDEQGNGDPAAGNWISGINPIDEYFVGNQDKLPESEKNNPSRNTYFFLPLILGILGFVYQYKNHKNDTLVVGFLFLITGIILILYLNPPPYEPRERDYVFVGSFQMFCVWIGLGVLFIFDLLNKKLSKNAALAVSSLAGILAGPYILAAQNWDDHNRSNRYLARDFAKNYLESCPKDAILFTNGDNDTYPLWYVQYVERFRTDVTIVNLSLLGSGEYAELLRNSYFGSKPVKFTLKANQVTEGKRDVTDYLKDNPIANPNQYYELSEIVSFVANETDPRAKASTSDGQQVNYLPSLKYKLSIDKSTWEKNKWISPGDTSVQPFIYWDLPRTRIYKNNLLLLDILANNINERPICFTTTTSDDTYIGLQNWFEFNGLVYRLIPTNTPLATQGGDDYGKINTDQLFDLFINKYSWGNMDKEKMWVDEKSRMVPFNIRSGFYRLAIALLNENKLDKAVIICDKIQEFMPDHNLRFSYNMTPLVEVYYRANQPEKAEKLANILVDEAIARMVHYRQVAKSAGKPSKWSEREMGMAGFIFQNIMQFATQAKRDAYLNSLQSRLSQAGLM